MSTGFGRRALLALGLFFAGPALADPPPPAPKPAPAGAPTTTATSTHASVVRGFSKEDLELMTAVDDLADLELLENWELLRLMPLLEGDDDE